MTQHAEEVSAQTVSQCVDMWPSNPLTLLFFVLKIELEMFLWFPMEINTNMNRCRKRGLVDNASSLCSLTAGPTKRSRSHSGQQTGREGLDDGGGDLPVPHARLHHYTLVACPSLLRPHRRRVSLNTPHTLAFCPPFSRVSHGVEETTVPTSP